jgi:hypothetical protein
MMSAHAEGWDSWVACHQVRLAPHRRDYTHYVLPNDVQFHIYTNTAHIVILKVVSLWAWWTILKWILERYEGMDWI